MANPVTGNRWFTTVLSKFIAELPLRKLTSNQTFDLAFDFLMVVLVIITFLVVDFGPRRYAPQTLLVLCTMGFAAWSLYINR